MASPLLLETFQQRLTGEFSRNSHIEWESKLDEALSDTILGAEYEGSRVERVRNKK